MPGKFLHIIEPLFKARVNSEYSGTPYSSETNLDNVLLHIQLRDAQVSSPSN